MVPTSPQPGLRRRARPIVVGARRRPSGTAGSARRRSSQRRPTRAEPARRAARARRPPGRAGRAARAAARSSAHRVAADADVAVGEQGGLASGPPPAAASKTSRRSAAPRGRGSARPPRARRRSRATHVPALGQRRGQPAGPAADVERRPDAAVEQRAVGVVGGRAQSRPAAARLVARRPRRPARRRPRSAAGEARSGERRASRHPRDPARPRANSRRGAVAATSVGVRRRCRRRAARPARPTASPSPLERGRVSSPGRRRRHRRRGQHAGAPRVAQREHPPAAVRGRPEHRVVPASSAAGDAVRSARRRPAGCPCPIWTDRARSDASRVGVGEPVGEAGPALRVHGPAGQRARGSRCRGPRRRGHRPARGDSRRRRPRRAQARQRVEQRGGGELGGRRRRRRRRRAGSWPARRPAPWPRPAARRARHESTLPEVAGGARGAAHRAGHLGAGARGPRVVGDVVLGDPPARAASAFWSSSTRVAEPPVAHVEVEQVARGGTPASARCRGPAARCGGAARPATSALPSRACQGHTPPRTGRRRPTARSARPDRTSASSGSRSAGSNEPSPSMTATQVAVGGEQPGVHGGAVPGRGSVTTRAPSDRRDLGGAVASSRCRPRSRAKPAGTRGSSAAQGGRLVAAREHRSQVGAMSFNARRRTAPPNGRQPLRIADDPSPADGRADAPT